MTKITISRHWANPKITTIVTDKEIALSMDISDFITAFKTELKWKARFVNIDLIIATIIKKVKEESQKVVV